ncbi:MAG: orotidine-5'-phosphate decarboxylase [Clostridiales Family XIII bacterium]|jgi:orotidine-5'-phosphate decarboxylase|nr:orotidine-5'-phosphate decarboxylase [Clostridiales Family XIII bacterium]
MIDKLADRIMELEAPIVVGLDPTLEMIPDRIKKEAVDRCGANLKAAASMLFDFNKEVIDGICEIVPAVKPQIAMYERFGADGVTAYLKTTEYAKSKGLFVIGDVKRGDISSTAEAYAAHIGGVEFEGLRFDPWHEDAVTINPYLGIDGVKPFLKVCEKNDKAIFVLVKTSNPSSAELQDLILESGGAVYEHAADLVSSWGEATVGASGYSKVGAVVGATHPAQGAALRKRMARTFFLVPGYGAQGASGKDLKGFFDADGGGCIVNSSRGIIAAWKSDDRYGENDVAEAAAFAALAMKADLREAFTR